MAITSTHPLYDAMGEIWELCEDSILGETRVKERGIKYLPPIDGMIRDGLGRDIDSVGARAYAAYKLRAVYPDLYREARKTAVGAMHRKPPSIKLPPQMKSLEKHATAEGESLEALIRRVNAGQIGIGRLGILGDIKRMVTEKGKKYEPRLSVYGARSIRNWNDDPSGDDDSTQDEVASNLHTLVLDESSHVMNLELEWKLQTKYRLLVLGGRDGGDFVANKTGGVYATAMVQEAGSAVGAEFYVPNRSGVELDNIPFSFINADDIIPCPEYPPLLGLALLCMAIYRGESDYRQNLFMTGQDTLVRIGHTFDPNEESVAIGSGATIDIANPSGDAKFIGVSGAGLEEQRTSLENDYTRAIQRGAQLIDGSSSVKESGEALKIRIAAQTTSYPNMAMTGAAGIEQVIKDMCPWFDADPDKVQIEPNLDFATDIPDGQTLVDVMTAIGLGAPFSKKSVHAFGFEQGITKMSFDEEMKEINQQEETVLDPALSNGVDDKPIEKQPETKKPEAETKADDQNN